MMIGLLLRYKIQRSNCTERVNRSLNLGNLLASGSVFETRIDEPSNKAESDTHSPRQHEENNGQMRNRCPENCLITWHWATHLSKYSINMLLNVLNCASRWDTFCPNDSNGFKTVENSPTISGLKVSMTYSEICYLLGRRMYVVMTWGREHDSAVCPGPSVNRTVVTQALLTSMFRRRWNQRVADVSSSSSLRLTFILQKR